MYRNALKAWHLDCRPSTSDQALFPQFENRQMAIEKQFDVSFISNLSLPEKQIQQNYRPIIAVDKWFARRPGTLFRGLILSEFQKEALQESFFRSHDFNGLSVADPFMGGGTPLIEANRVGCDIAGYYIM
jgi:putative DNA methylase